MTNKSQSHEDGRFAGGLTILPAGGQRGLMARLVAAVLAAALASSPAVSLAGEPDLEREGDTDPGLVSPDDSSQSPDFDPGGPSTELPEEAPAAPAPTTPGDEGELDGLEQDPPADPAVPFTDDGSQPQQLPAPQPVAPDPAPPIAPPPAGGAEPIAVPPPPAIDEGHRSPEKRGKPEAPGKPQAREHHKRDQPETRESTKVVTAPLHVATSTPTTIAVAAPPAPPAEQPVAAQSDPPPAASGRIHVVRPDECLWTIAKALLGPDATTDQIGRLVARLWALNAERIGTGDPNRIFPGQRLLVP